MRLSSGIAVATSPSTPRYFNTGAVTSWIGSGMPALRSSCPRWRTTKTGISKPHSDSPVKPELLIRARNSAGSRYYGQWESFSFRSYRKCQMAERYAGSLIKPASRFRSDHDRKQTRTLGNHGTSGVGPHGWCGIKPPIPTLAAVSRSSFCPKRSATMPNEWRDPSVKQEFWRRWITLAPWHCCDLRPRGN